MPNTCYIPFYFGFVYSPLSSKQNFKNIIMSEVASYYKREKWYNKSIFPLVPIITIKKAEEHNTSGFTFRWLFFQFWTLDSFQFELAINVDTHWGIGVTFVLPYFRGVIAIPCPEKIRTFIYKHLSRKCSSVR